MQSSALTDRGTSGPSIGEQLTRDLEFVPKSCYPPDVYREPMKEWPKDFALDLTKVIPQTPPEG
jgi:hypothetical protein